MKKIWSGRLNTTHYTNEPADLMLENQPHSGSVLTLYSPDGVLLMRVSLFMPGTPDLPSDEFYLNDVYEENAGIAKFIAATRIATPTGRRAVRTGSTMVRVWRLTPDANNPKGTPT